MLPTNQPFALKIVFESHKEKRSSYAPETGVRYDGIYRIEKCWRKVGIQGFKVCRYLFVRCDNEPAPWTSDTHGDQPRPLPEIKELKNATDITERKEKPAWDYDEGYAWKWTKPPPMSRKSLETANPEDRKRGRRSTQNLSVRERLLKEFSCLLCRKVMTLPLTTPCAHNFCKSCLEGAFAGQAFVRERSREGGRSLRAQKNVMKCPSCLNDISDFLQNPQVNRELMDVIESLKRQSEESVEGSNDEESDVTDENRSNESEGSDEKKSNEIKGLDEKVSDEVNDDLCNEMHEVLKTGSENTEMLDVCNEEGAENHPAATSKRKKTKEMEKNAKKRKKVEKADDSQSSPYKVQVPHGDGDDDFA
ncbi:E3 ubiquitin-protein ligase ORTHRUS 2 [Asimina triloba]